MIRAGLPGDAAPIAAIWNAVIDGSAATFNSRPYAVAEIAALIEARAAAGHATFVADDAGVIGFATYAPFRGGAGYRFTMEHTVHLAPAVRGRGVGRALMAAVEAHAAAAGVRSMIAAVSAENPGGAAFHARLGYARVAVLPGVGFKFGRFIDLILLQKVLAPISPDAGRQSAVGSRR